MPGTEAAAGDDPAAQRRRVEEDPIARSGELEGGQLRADPRREPPGIDRRSSSSTRSASPTRCSAPRPSRAISGDSWRHGPEDLDLEIPAASTRCGAFGNGQVSDAAVRHWVRPQPNEVHVSARCRSLQALVKTRTSRRGSPICAATRQRRVASCRSVGRRSSPRSDRLRMPAGALERLLDSGVDVLRVNLSHATPARAGARRCAARAPTGPTSRCWRTWAARSCASASFARTSRSSAGDTVTLGAGGIPRRRSVALRPGARRRPGLRRGRNDRARRHRRAARSPRLPGSRRRHAALAQGHQPARTTRRRCPR